MSDVIVTLNIPENILTLSKNIFKYISKKDSYKILFEYCDNTQTSDRDAMRYCLMPSNAFDNINNLFPDFVLTVNQDNIHDIVTKYHFVSNVPALQVILPEEEVLYYKLKNAELFDSLVKDVEPYSGDIFIHLEKRLTVY